MVCSMNGVVAEVAGTVKRLKSPVVPAAALSAIPGDKEKVIEDTMKPKQRQAGLNSTDYPASPLWSYLL